MTIALGRAGRDSGLTLNSPYSWSLAGDDADVRGYLTADSYVHLILLREQVNGLIDNIDEPVIAVSWPGDATRDGYYEVVDGSVQMPPRGQAALRLEYALRLRRVSVYPLLESILGGNVVRPNAHSIVKGGTVPWWAPPADATQDYVPNASTATRVAETGSLTVWYRTDGTELYNTVRPWTCAAADRHDGEAKIEFFDGSAWYTMVGRRLPNIAAGAATWRITNGLCRVLYGGGDGLLKVEHWVQSLGSWAVSKTYKLTVTTSATAIGTFRSLVVHRNSPECVSIQLGLDQSSGSPAAMTVDLVLRRGSLYVEGLLSRTSEVAVALANEMGLFRSVAMASTAHTSGIHQTTADSAPNGGGKAFLNTALAKTNDLTNGGFYVSSAVNAFDFQIGYEPASAAGPDTFTNQTFAYFAPLDETTGFSKR